MSLVEDEGKDVEKRLRALGIFIPAFEQALGLSTTLNGLGLIDLFKLR
jgi:hypothetical protein